MTTASAPEWPDNPALFLDLDGTLLEFALDPATVEVPDRLQPILDGLAAATDGAIAFVSGRALDELDRLLHPHRFALAGAHGLERRGADGRQEPETASSDPDLARARDVLRQLADRHDGTLLEDKGVTFALHYRRRPELEQELIDEVRDRLAGLAPSLGIIEGNNVIEIKPTTHNKGTAIEAFMREAPFSGRTPVFVGDDTTDEDGFRVVNALSGISVKVADGASCAQFRLPDIDAVIDWLDELVARPRR